MTDKQRQRWDRWHRAGKTLYLCRNTLGSGLSFCAVYYALSLLSDQDVDWKRCLIMGASVAFINLIIADSIWKQKEAEYALSDRPDR